MWNFLSGDYNVDLGGQWVHGEGENVVLKLADPLGLVDKTDDPLKKSFYLQYFDSKGNLLEDNLMKNLTDYYFENLVEFEADKKTSYKSVGDFAEKL